MLCYKCKAYKSRKCLFDGFTRTRCERTSEDVLKELNIINSRQELDAIASEYQIERDENKKELLKYKWYKRLRRG